MHKSLALALLELQNVTLADDLIPVLVRSLRLLLGNLFDSVDLQVPAYTENQEPVRLSLAAENPATDGKTEIEIPVTVPEDRGGYLKVVTSPDNQPMLELLARGIGMATLAHAMATRHRLIAQGSGPLLAHLNRIRSQTTPEGVQRQLGIAVYEVLGVDRAVMVTLNKRTGILDLVTIFADGVPEVNESLPAALFPDHWVEPVTSGRPITADSSHVNSLQPPLAQRWHNQGIRAMLVVPLVRAADNIWAVSLHQVRSDRHWEAETITAATLLAEQAGFTLKSIELMAEVRLHADRAQRLTQLLTRVTESDDIETTIRIALEDLVKAVGADRGHYADIFTEAGIGRVRAQYSRDAENHLNFDFYPLTILDQAALDRFQAGRPTYSNDLKIDPDTGPVKQLLRQFGLRSAVVSPVVIHGQWLGTLGVSFVDIPHVWTPEELEFIRTVGNQLGFAVLLSRAKERLERSLGERSERERAAEQVLDMAPDMLLTLDNEGRILDCNATGLRMLGYERDELVGRPVSDLMPVSVQARIQRYLADMSDRTEVSVAETVLRTKSGWSIDVQVGAAPLRDRNDFALGARLVIRDVSANRAMAQQLMDTQRMDSLSTLSAGLAHDLNNTFAGLMGYLSLLDDLLPDDSPLRTHLDAASKALDRSADLTAKLRLFARGDASAPHERYDLAKTVKDTVRLFEAGLPSQISLELRGCTADAFTEGSPGQMRQLLMNLLLNSREALRGGGHIVVDLDETEAGPEEAKAYPWVTPGKFWRLTVTDNGVGIAPEHLSHVFEPFYTTHAGARGLGLSVAYGVARQHGGFVEIKSRPGDGTAVMVVTPLVEAPGEAPVEPPTQPVATVSGDGETVLVIDDDPLVRQFLVEALQTYGYRVLTAPGGVEGLAAYRNADPQVSLVVLDYMMPRMNGLETLRALKEIDVNVRVIVATGYAEEGAAQSLISDGALAVLPKPFRVKTLVDSVRGALAGNPV